jgi:hypothetical protein
MLAALSAVGLALPSAGGASSNVAMSSSHLSVTVAPDLIFNSLRAGRLIIEPYSDALRRNAFRVRPRDSSGNNIRTSDGDCFGNNAANDVVCSGTPPGIRVLGSRLADRVTIRERDEDQEDDTCKVPPPAPILAELDLGDGDDLLRISATTFGDPFDVCSSGLVAANINEAPIRVVASGGEGADDLEGENLDDTLGGGGGDDLLDGNEGADTLRGDAGDDSLFGNEGGDTLEGLSGADTLDGGSSGDTLRGGDDADVLRADSGADNVDAGAGDDQIDGGSGDDTLAGGEGDDVFDGAGTGADAIDGGPGFDKVDYSAAGARVEVFLDGLANDGRRAPAPEGDNLIGIERVIGTPLSDVLAGEADLVGGDGDDFIFGSSQGDDLEGGRGRDQLTGGPNPGQPSGNDRINSRDGVADVILCGDGFDVLESDLADPQSSDCEINLRFAVDDGPPSSVRALRLRPGGVRAVVGCPRDARTRCAGVLTLGAGGRVLGRVRYAVPLGRSRAVLVALPRRVLRGLHGGDALTARTRERGVSHKGPRTSRAAATLRA